MLGFQNIDLLFVAISVVGILVLGFSVYFNDPKSTTNRSFFFFSITATLWSIANYLYLQFSSPYVVLWLLRLHAFFAVFYTFSLFNLFLVFPKTKFSFPKIYKFGLVPIVLIVASLTLTPFVFSKVTTFSSDGVVTGIDNGPAIFIFGGLVVLLVVGGFSTVIARRTKTQLSDRHKFFLVVIGGLLTFALHIIFNFVFPIFLKNSDFVSLGAVFVLPFVGFSSYSIIKHKLFNMKIIVVSLLVFILSLTTFFEIVLADNLSLIIYRSVVLILVLTFGIFLIRSVKKEVDQREHIEKLVTELEQVNNRLWVANDKLKELDRMKTEFVSIATHQLRSPLTAIKGYSSMIIEGSFGPIGEKAKGAVDVIFQSSQKLVRVIEDFLNITRIELGTMKYEQEEIDLKKMVNQIILELKPSVENKGLHLFFEPAADAEFKTKGDSGKLSQVIGNLVDNASKYTPPKAADGSNGWIKVKLEKVAGRVRVVVADNGVGILAETIPKLFQKFIRAEDAGKINISGTGLGLYVARQIVEAHKGKIWAESQGKGKGSRFIVEL